MGSLRSRLLALWWEAKKLEAQAESSGGPLSTAQLLALRRRLRCDGDRTARKIDDPCVNGPPNLGYAY